MLSWYQFGGSCFSSKLQKRPIARTTSNMPRLHLLRSSYDLFVYDFPYDFFHIVGGYKLRRMCLHCLRSPYDFFGGKLGQNLTETLRIGYRTTTARLSYNHRVIFTTSLYKSHDAPTMTLRKSQGVGTLTVLLSCNYVHGFKRPSMFIFGFHVNCVSKSCDHKSCYEEASVFS